MGQKFSKSVRNASFFIFENDVLHAFGVDIVVDKPPWDPPRVGNGTNSYPSVSHLAHKSI